MDFNWQEFMSGKLVVHCESKELAEDFLSVCKQKGIEVGNKVEVGNKWGYRFSFGAVLFNGLDCYRDYGYKIVEWQSNKKDTLNFFDVVSSLKEGDTYICGDKHIEYKEGCILIGDGTGCVSFSMEDEFEKIATVVDSEVALKAMFEGKVVKLVSNNHKYRLNKDLKVEVYSLLGWMQRCTMTDFLSKGKENEWIILGEENTHDI